MIEEGIRGGICHAVDRYTKANNQYMKDCDASKESSYIQYLDANNLYGAAMSEKLPINGFKWVSDILGIKIVVKFIYSKWMLITRANYTNYTAICHFYPKG